MIKVFEILFTTLLITSCSINKTDTNKCNYSIDLRGDNTEPVYQLIETISVLDLKIGNSWGSIFTPFMVRNDNNYIFIDEQSNYLQIYDGCGNNIHTKLIKGRGHGELLNVGNVFSRDGYIYVYDDSYGHLMKYNKNGHFESKWNKIDQTIEDYVYYIGNNRYVGLNNSIRKDNKYVHIYDESGTCLNKFCPLPKYLIDNPTKFGKLPNSYLVYDTLRFILPYDYNIYSVTENSFSTTYRFIPESPIPAKLLKGYDITKNKYLLFDIIMEMESLVLSGGYDCMFQNLLETDRYLYFKYISNSVFKTCIFDKTNAQLYRTDFPSKIYNKEFAPNLNTEEIWQHLIYNIVPLYSDGLSLYGKITITTYEMLKDCSDKLDDRLLSLKNNLEDYIKANNITLGDAIIVKISLQ